MDHSPTSGHFFPCDSCHHIGRELYHPLDDDGCNSCRDCVTGKGRYIVGPLGQETVAFRIMNRVPISPSATFSTVVLCRPGAGKATILKSIADAYMAKNTAVLAITPTALSSQALHDSTGIPSRTLPSILAECENAPAPFGPNTVLFLQQSGSPAFDQTKLLRHAKDLGSTVIIVADPEHYYYPNRTAS